MSVLMHDLGRGLAGSLVYRAVLARHSNRWSTAHATAAMLAAQPAAIHPAQTGLYRGAPALAYALHTAGHPAYRNALTTLDTAVASLVENRLQQAHRRMGTGTPPRMREYDLISGLTGLGALLLYRATNPPLLDRVLGYVVELLRRPVSIGGHQVPGWWASDGPNGRPDPEWPTGHGNFGMAHGVAGPLALLALSARAGHTIPGQKQALARTCRLLAQWARPLPGGGTAWPETVTLDAWLSGPPPLARPGRPSWCYGTPGIARALQLAAIATHRTADRLHAEDALISCATSPEQLARLDGATVCHGWAGLCLTLDRAATEAAPNSRLRRAAPALCAQFEAHTTRHHPPATRGLLTGTDGILLVQHTLNAIHPVIPKWETCLLLD